MATLTSTGINCSNGTLDGQYTGTDSQQASLPIGAYVWCASRASTFGRIDVNNTIPTIKYYTANGADRTQYFTSSSASSANYANLAGTWRNRGGQYNYCEASVSACLVQRVA